MVGADVHLGTLKSGKERTVVLPEFVVDELAKTCRGKQHGDLILPARDGGHLGPPPSHDSWLSGAVERCQTAAVRARAKESKRDNQRLDRRVGPSRWSTRSYACWLRIGRRARLMACRCGQ